MKKFFAVVYALITALAIGGAFWVMFVTINARDTLVYSPYVGLCIMIPLILLPFSLFITTIARKTDDEGELKENIVSNIIRFSKIYSKNHGYPLNSAIMHDIIEFSMKFKYDPRPKSEVIKDDEKEKGK